MVLIRHRQPVAAGLLIWSAAADTGTAITAVHAVIARDAVIVSSSPRCSLASKFTHVTVTIAAADTAGFSVNVTDTCVQSTITTDTFAIAIDTVTIIVTAIVADTVIVTGAILHKHFLQAIKDEPKIETVKHQLDRISCQGYKRSLIGATLGPVCRVSAGNDLSFARLGRSQAHPVRVYKAWLPRHRYQAADDSLDSLTSLA
ncbi:uncharacterized protein BJ171DRAFT_578597 [Polychytrium aggregatum]|uniref:uncharacterized protein n=1 Tax=Polychytrium aggregatum TaxID=110093 RepID=UPI0022FEDB04|nr:uncharacterized protein BJ171DRAFT_578597 [Polychytrium aggregatum]KAI9207478.1 hypothetical protein BJ171DRAFT_578597 [Polychytrium aggregatum]